MKKLQNNIQALASLDVAKYVRKASGKCEENVKIKIVIPLLELLGYSIQQDMDFEHHVANKRADIALLFDGKPKLFVESKDLDENLDDHIHQALNYAFDKGVEWVIMTNGIEVRVYKSFIPNIPHKDRMLFSTTLLSLPETFDTLSEFVSRDSLREARKLTEKAETIRENITTKILIDDLSECRKRLFADLFAQFKARYETDSRFKEIIDSWAIDVKMDVSDPALIEKLCKEGAYTLINRVLFLRICEDKGHIKAKLSKDAITKWREMVENPAHLLDMAFKEISSRFEGLYKSPLFDAINFEDIDWDKNTINFIIDKLGEHDFSRISKDILGKAYEQHISREERKQLGQFYTPDFVIDYILDQVGVSPEKKILDPACGSGGFLMKAYDRLRKQYLEQGWAEEVIHEQILKNNLYGIDINPFATQLTVMNLLLKDLDHPTGEINIIQGDSLDKTYDGLDMDILHTDSPLSKVTSGQERISLVRLLRKRPFEVVVSNPPYGARLSKIELQRYGKSYQTAVYQLDTYCLFLERALDLLADGGYLGFIVPTTFLNNRYSKNLRKHIVEHARVVNIVDLTGVMVFPGVAIDNLILILQKQSNKAKLQENDIAIHFARRKLDEQLDIKFQYSIPQTAWDNPSLNPDYLFNIYLQGKTLSVVSKIKQECVKLGNIAKIRSGINAGENSPVVSESRTSNLHKPVIGGRNIGRYQISYRQKYILYDIELLKSKGHSPRDESIFLSPEKVVIQDIRNLSLARRLVCAYDSGRYYLLRTLNAILPSDASYNLKYLLALLNSTLMNYYFSKNFITYRIKPMYLEQLPIKPATSEKRQELVTLVDKILSLNKQLNDPGFINQREAIQKEIDATDAEIDEKVYQLYGLTNEEKRIVEASFGANV